MAQSWEAARQLVIRPTGRTRSSVTSARATSRPVVVGASSRRSITPSSGRSGRRPGGPLTSSSPRCEGWNWPGRRAPNNATGLVHTEQEDTQHGRRIIEGIGLPRLREKALSINPEETGALLITAEVFLLQGKESEADQRLEWICRTNPRAVEAILQGLAEGSGNAPQC